MVRPGSGVGLLVRAGGGGGTPKFRAVTGCGEWFCLCEDIGEILIPKETQNLGTLEATIMEYVMNQIFDVHRIVKKRSKGGHCAI